jgi:hypothetical protein
MIYALRHKPAASIPNGVFESFRWFKTSGRTTALVSTQPLTEMTTRKTAGALGWQPCHILVPTVWKSWEYEPPGALRAYLGVYKGQLLNTIFHVHLHLYKVSDLVLFIREIATEDLEHRKIIFGCFVKTPDLQKFDFTVFQFSVTWKTLWTMSHF